MPRSYRKISAEDKLFIKNNLDLKPKKISEFINCNILTVNHYRTIFFAENANITLDKKEFERPKSEYTNEISLYPELGYRGGLGTN